MNLIFVATRILFIKLAPAAKKIKINFDKNYQKANSMRVNKKIEITFFLFEMIWFVITAILHWRNINYLLCESDIGCSLMTL